MPFQRLHPTLIRLFERKDASSLSEVLNHPSFKNFLAKYDLNIPLARFIEACTHTSFTHEFQLPNQEQLEFLGDSVLQLVLTHKLYELYPKEKEGRLSKLRSAVVNEKSLAKLAQGLGLDEMILVGKGEFHKNLHHQESVLADTFEAIIGQVYLHQGLVKARDLILGWLDTFLPDALSFESIEDFDAKSKLQERSLAKFKKLPRYSAIQEGDKFLVSVWVNEVEVARGLYSSKKIGEKDLASLVLKQNLI